MSDEQWHIAKVLQQVMFVGLLQIFASLKLRIYGNVQSQRSNKEFCVLQV